MSYFNEIFYRDFTGILSGFQDFDEKTTSRNQVVSQANPVLIRVVQIYARRFLVGGWDKR